jgi:hypothetical protein
MAARKKKQVSLSVKKGEKLPASRGAGLTAKGRAKYNKATGSKLKAPQPGGGKRKKSYCSRSAGQMKMHGITAEVEVLMDNKIFIAALLGFCGWIGMAVTDLKTEVAVVNVKVTENHKMLSVLWDDFLGNRHDNIAKLNIKVN